ncbi:MAG TPA: hypothetical protein VJ792_04030 [Candidatus Nitrosotalea sp.]|nr:hypothetical protein [Candidatus Nitrosotalea sp.]
MKASHAILAGVFVLVSIVALMTSFPLKLLWVLSNSYDFEPTTNENPFGMNATISYRGGTTGSCHSQNCMPGDNLVLTYRSGKPVEITSYNICGGLYCILQQGISSYGQEGTQDHPVWGDSIRIKDAPWKVGDTVDIRLKVVPVGLSKEGIVPESENTLFIDLGDSKIRMDR